MRIVFDPAKSNANVRARGLAFADAARLWQEGPVVEIEDRRRPYGETRMLATGPIAGRLHVVVYTDRGGERRIVSFRKANRRESDAWKARTAV